MWASRSSGLDRARKPRPHRRDDALDLERRLGPAHQVGLAGRRPLVAGHRRVLVVEDDVQDVLVLLDRVGHRGHLAVEEGAVAHQDVVLVGDERRRRRRPWRRRAPSPRGRASRSNGRQEGHRVAADAPVGDRVHRLAVVHPAHVDGVGEALADLGQRGAGAAMRAARAVGGRAGGHGEGPPGQRAAPLVGVPRPLEGAGRDGVRGGPHQPRRARPGRCPGPSRPPPGTRAPRRGTPCPTPPGGGPPGPGAPGPPGAGRAPPSPPPRPPGPPGGAPAPGRAAR